RFICLSGAFCTDARPRCKGPRMVIMSDDTPQRAICMRGLKRPALGVFFGRVVALLAGWCFCAQQVNAGSLDHASAVGPSKLPLAESDRVFLANIEQRGLRLSMRAFPAISAGISNAQPEQISRFFSPDFAGQTLDWSWGSGPAPERIRIRRVGV